MKNNKFPENLKAALIDMDGVLYDSMPYHVKAWHAMLSEIGIEIKNPDEFYLYEGMTGDDTIQMFIKREFHRDATEEEKKHLYRRKAEFFCEAGEKKKMPYAGQMLGVLREAGINTVLVTGSAQESLIDSLERDYPGYFPMERMVTALDVKKGKPDPEPYLRGLGKAGVKKDEAIIIENAPLGVRAGKAAGIFTIAVTTGPIPREEFEKEGADMIFQDMKSFAEWLNEKLPSEPVKKLDLLVAGLHPDKVLVVTDSNVEQCVIPQLSGSKVVSENPIFILNQGEEAKDINSVIKIWNKLEEIGATRKSLVINIGGGMVTDTGGFAAATYKRGIRTLNFPTTLLGAVDAATGGKTGVNFNGLKNEIGAFHAPVDVIISSMPLATLSRKELLSGYAEMLKTALIADKKLYLAIFNVENVLSHPETLQEAMKRCVDIKEEIVSNDPTEKGLRKILNFGHTVGHAFESLLKKKGTPVPHGYAVAHGMLVELLLSHIVKKFPSLEAKAYGDEILKPFYVKFPFSCGDIPDLMNLMAHDKKNDSFGEPDFTLLKEIGEPVYGCHPSLNEIEIALDIYLSDAF